MYSSHESFYAGPSAVPSQGSEKRISLLPTKEAGGVSFLGSSYNPANAMKTPADLGIRVGNSMEDVVAAVKGVGFYADQIGFGAPSNGLTNGMPLQPLGVNYFMKTGASCSNGADMWEYMKGITEGDALGQQAKKAMADMGLPPLKGLAPGIIEDAQAGLNPMPLMNALFGSGYPQCKKETLMVGDSYGQIKDPSTGESWISDPDTATQSGGVWYQTRWVQDTDRNGRPVNLSHDEWLEAPKTFNADGTEKTAQGFRGFMKKPGTIFVVGILCLLAFGVVGKRMR